MQQQDPSWGQQFKNAVQLGPQIDEDNLIVQDVDGMEAFLHFFSIGWKLLFATIPPAKLAGGYPCFVASLIFIGVVTAIVGEVATLFGCTAGLKESIAAISIVALGTSLPDTFASQIAAKTSDTADSAIGNITGSNSVNVFLGLGLPWLLGSTYWKNNFGKAYEVPSGPLSFSVFVFLLVALICFIILIARRMLIGGELGGSATSRYISSAVLVFLWIIYLLLCILQVYGIV